MELSKEEKMDLIMQLRCKTGMGIAESQHYLKQNNWNVEDTIKALTIVCRMCGGVIKLWQWNHACDGSAYFCRICGFDNRTTLQ
jgi:hypothetical protein